MIATTLLAFKVLSIVASGGCAIWSWIEEQKPGGVKKNRIALLGMVASLICAISIAAVETHKNRRDDVLRGDEQRKILNGIRNALFPLDGMLTSYTFEISAGGAEYEKYLAKLVGATATLAKTIKSDPHKYPGNECCGGVSWMSWASQKGEGLEFAIARTSPWYPNESEAPTLRKVIEGGYELKFSKTPLSDDMTDCCVYYGGYNEYKNSDWEPSPPDRVGMQFRLSDYPDDHIRMSYLPNGKMYSETRELSQINFESDGKMTKIEDLYGANLYISTAHDDGGIDGRFSQFKFNLKNGQVINLLPKKITRKRFQCLNSSSCSLYTYTFPGTKTEFERLMGE